MEMKNKIREVLKEMTEFLELWNDELHPLAVDDGESLISKAKTILAEPPRNCDIGTAEEQLKRFKDFCRIISKDETCDGCPLLPQCSTLEHCTLAWAQMPYKKGGVK